MCTRVWCIVVGYGVASNLVLWSPVGAPAGVPGPRRNADDCDAGWFAPVATRRRPMLRPFGPSPGARSICPGGDPPEPPTGVAGWGDLAVSARGGDPPEPPLGCWLGRSRSICPGWRSSGAPIGLLAGEISQYLPGVKILRSPPLGCWLGDLAVSARGESPGAPTWVLDGGMGVTCRRRPSCRRRSSMAPRATSSSAPPCWNSRLVWWVLS